jgi:cell wall-associated NlpC family hydrolase
MIKAVQIRTPDLFSWSGGADIHIRMSAHRLRLASLLLTALAVLAPACAGRQPHVRVLPPALPPEAYDPAAAGVAAAPPAAPAAAAAGMEVARIAGTLIGAPYREGGALPDGFDCSGLVNYVFARSGVAVPRDVRRQAAAGLPVARSDVIPGDLVFFATTGSGPTHVGIAIGGNRFIHAPKSGAAVRVESLSSAYWTARFVTARRIPVPGV